MMMKCNIYGVGFNSKGQYRAYEGDKQTKCYKAWIHMLERCYDLKYQERIPTYKDCEVCKEWHDYQNFAKWYHDNFYFIEGERMCLDKDILVKHNKLYSPDTCVFAPQGINSLFTKSNNKRGKLPIGVGENGNGYRAICSNGNDKLVPLGTFKTPHEAFLMYKINKELVIQGIANEYKDKIPTELYDAMMAYEVEEWD